MDNSEKVLLRAKIAYFFKETFRAHSKAEYREIFSRGLNEDNGGVTGAFPWLYVRAFFALLMLFTVNILILRLTNNVIYVPSVTFLGGITFTIPFFILLFELYPKRDVSMFALFALLVGGGTIAGVLCQLGYAFIPINNGWISAIVAGVLEEVCKAAPAMIAIVVFNKKNRYACFLMAAAVGAGFSIIEDMGYIFYYSDKYVLYYGSDVQATVSLFVNRGLTSFCTHVLWTGAVGWAYSVSKRPFRSFGLLVLGSSILIHISWDLPLEGWVKALVTVLCVVATAVINITIVHLSRMRTYAAEADITRLNDSIIKEAKKMGERMRFTNAANLTFALTCTFLSVIILALCSLPIGVDFTRVDFANSDEFISYVECGYNLNNDRTRRYDPDGRNVEERYIEGVCTYVIQQETKEGYDGEYFYGYYLRSDGTGELDSVAVGLEVNGLYTRVYSKDYKFGSETVWAFEIAADTVKDYTFNSDGSVTAVVNADEFEGYDYLIALCGTGTAIALGCNVILVAFSLKLRRSKNDI